MIGRTPREVRDVVAQGERVLSWAMVPGSGWAVATDAALYLPVLVERSPGGAGATSLRLPWELITKASWTDEGALVVEGRPQARGRDQGWMVRLDDPRTLPTVVYERVTSTVVVSERVALAEDAGARIVARRADGGLKWTVTFDAGLDPTDPVLRSRAEEALADLRSTFGV